MRHMESEFSNAFDHDEYHLLRQYNIFTSFFWFIVNLIILLLTEVPRGHIRDTNIIIIIREK